MRSIGDIRTLRWGSCWWKARHAGGCYPSVPTVPECPFQIRTSSARSSHWACATSSKHVTAFSPRQTVLVFDVVSFEDDPVVQRERLERGRRSIWHLAGRGRFGQRGLFVLLCLDSTFGDLRRVLLRGVAVGNFARPLGVGGGGIRLGFIAAGAVRLRRSSSFNERSRPFFTSSASPEDLAGARVDHRCLG